MRKLSDGNFQEGTTCKKHAIVTIGASNAIEFYKNEQHQENHAIDMFHMRAAIELAVEGTKPRKLQLSLLAQVMEQGAAG